MLPRRVFLTFDVEDFINDRSLRALMLILKLLKKYSLTGLFFITGHMTERIGKNSKILGLLEDHEIGYHSSAHSVRPIIPEFTDMKSYSRAVRNSLIRETSHINVLTGEPEEEGGIKILREIFSNKDVIAFRAPGGCWTPPHLQALQKLGIRFDFSAKLFGAGISYENPITFKGVTFYPFPIVFGIHWKRSISKLLRQILKQKTTCLSMHEWTFVNSEIWDSIFWQSNPRNLTVVPSLTDAEIATNFAKLNTLLKGLKFLEKLGAVEVTPTLEGQRYRTLDITSLDIVKTYQFSVTWAKSFFNYQPKHILSHFYKYFNH